MCFLYVEYTILSSMDSPVDKINSKGKPDGQKVVLEHMKDINKTSGFCCTPLSLDA